MRTRKHTLALGILLLMLLSLPSCKERSPQPASHEHEPASGDASEQSEHDAHADEVKLSSEAIQRYGIKIEPAAKHVLVPTLLAPARVSYNTEAMAHVGSPLRGRVTELKVRLGGTVKKGDPVLMIESPELGEAQSDYLQKRAAALAAGPPVDLAQSAHERARALYDKSQGIALTEVQKREADYRAAQAALMSARTAAVGAENRLHLFGMNQQAVESLVATGEVAPRVAITAPIAGQVVEREVTLGELVSPEKEALLVLANLDTLWVLADVPEARLQEIAVGGKVRVTVGTGEGASFNGSVAFISPSVDPSTRSAQVRIEVQDGRLSLRPGMFARVEIETRPVGRTQEPVLAVPDEAVQTVEGGPAVFVPVAGEENTFGKRAITVGRAVGGMVPVLSGLEEGESYVAAGSFLMKAELGKGSASHED
jgi:cobalt-zinc-cadmium efflux system membrane fusion protein